MSFNQLSLSDLNNGSINWFDDASSKPQSPTKPSSASISSRLSIQSIQMSPPAIQPPPPKKQRIPSSFLSSYKIHELMMESSSHNQSLSSTLVEALARWLVCVMVVQFDVEIGPDLKIIQPAIQFTEEDFQAICFSSLPERSSSKESKSQFHSFRFQSSTFPDTLLHGYALFSQQRSQNSSRGYIQESLVIVSRLDYPQLFNACLQLMVDIVDDNHDFNSNVQQENDMICNQVRRKIHERDGFVVDDDDSSIRKRKLNYATTASNILDEKLPIIHTAISNISQWPDPDVNSTLELGFLGTIINLSIPLYDSMPLLGTVDLDTKCVNFHSRTVKGLSKHSVSTSDLTTFSCDPKIYAKHNAPVITATEPSANWDYLVNFLSDVSDLYILYEYMLLAKPIVVYSSSPHLCSSFISLLVDLIRPIPYAGRIRDASGNTVNILRNLSRKSLVTGSTTSLPGSLAAATASTSTSARGSVDLARGNSRSSMLSLSSLGVKFNGSSGDGSDGMYDEKTGVYSDSDDRMNTDEEIFHYTTPPALPLQPPAPRRTASRKFSGKHTHSLLPPPAAGQINEEDEQSTNSQAGTDDGFGENGLAPVATLLPGFHESRIKRFQKQTADLHKQSIYKTFIHSDNFKEWLHMNNVNNNRKA